MTLLLFLLGAVRISPANASHGDAVAALHATGYGLLIRSPLALEERPNDLFAMDGRLHVKLPRALSTGERALRLDRAGRLAAEIVEDPRQFVVGDVDLIVGAILRNYEFAKEPNDARTLAFDEAFRSMAPSDRTSEIKAVAAPKLHPDLHDAHLALRLVQAHARVSAKGRSYTSGLLGAWLFDRVCTLENERTREGDSPSPEQFVELLAALAKHPGFDRELTKTVWIDFLERMNRHFEPVSRAHFARRHRASRGRWIGAGALAMGTLDGLWLWAFGDLIGPQLGVLAPPLVGLSAAGGAIAAQYGYSEYVGPWRSEHHENRVRSLLAKCEADLEL